VRNPRYWRAGLPYLDGVTFAVDEVGRNRVEHLQAGTLDVSAFSFDWDLASLDQAVAAQGPTPQLAVDRDPGDAEKTHIVFNTTRPPLNDLRVRQALAYATDPLDIARRNGWPLDRRAQGPLDPASPYFASAPYPTYNLDRARALVREYLSDTRVPNRPREIAFTLTAANIDNAFVTDLAEQWAKVGIKASITYVDVKQIVRLVVTGNHDASVFRYFASVDPDVLWHFFVNDTIVDGGISLNFAHLRSAALTDAMNQGRSTLDVRTRQVAYARAQQIMAEQLPMVWLQRTEWRIAHRPRVRDARNVTLPDGAPALPYMAGTYRLTETWLDR
jgi:ABC-type transport system substrate-binding protein